MFTLESLFLSDGLALPFSTYASHLLPEKFPHPRESIKWVTVTAPLLVWFRRQPEGSRQFRIRFRDVFVTAPAGQPAVEGSRHHAPLLQGSFRNECAAKIVKLGDLQQIRPV